MTREVAWAGFGFQIWLQLLTHFVRAHEANMLIVDEPEIYLHPDLQRQIVEVLRGHGARVLLATHSVEIINEVEPSEVLLIEPGRSSARRLADIDGLQQAVDLLGSSQNMHLSRLARARRVLFVEGQDRELLSRFAARLGSTVFSGGRLTVIPIGGFSEYQRVANAQWAFVEVLGQSLQVALLLDRDYRCEEEAAQIIGELKSRTSLVHILQRKEIENYLLVPRAIQAAVDRKLSARVERGILQSMPAVNVEDLLEECADALKVEIGAQMAMSYMRFLRSSGKDQATLLIEHTKQFEDTWKLPEKRLRVVPGKEVLASLNGMLERKYGVSVSPSHIIRMMRANEVATDLVKFIEDLQGLADA